MRNFVTITLAEMQRAFSKKDANGKGWTEGKAGRNEVVFDFPLADNCTLRVWSSIRQDNGLGRGNGDDAIRVAIFNPLTQKGLVKVPHVKRIVNWESNLRKRIQEAVSEYRRRYPIGG